jgi:hypothetical protein
MPRDRQSPDEEEPNMSMPAHDLAHSPGYTRSGDDCVAGHFAGQLPVAAESMPESETPIFDAVAAALSAADPAAVTPDSLGAASRPPIDAARGGS